MAAASSSSFVIGGVRVNFPLKPYPSQVAMIGQIIKGLNRSENCLLESPTGTGKSLALLCSTLAWQAAEEERVQKYNALLDQGITDPDILNRVYGSLSGNVVSNASVNTSVSDLAPNLSIYTQSSSLPSSNVTGNSSAPGNESGTTLEGGFVRGDDDDDAADFRSGNSTFRTSVGTNALSENRQIIDSTSDNIFEAANRNANNHLRKKRAPKIYFGTRTHKQISQIVRELRKTKYSNVRSVVLGSRNHSCIHPVVSKSKSKNESCKILRDNKDGESCSFYHGVNRMKTHEQLHNLGYSAVCDLEDIVKIGKKVKACPYYASRHLMETSQIIFCPYNYLIDPLIRESMSIDLRKSIVVLDEAHNVEDSCREAASFSLNLDALLEAKIDLEKLSLTYGVKPESCEPLIKLLSNLALWMESNKDNLTDYSDFGRSGKIFTGNEMVTHLSHLDVDPKNLSNLENCLNKLNEDDEGDYESYKPASATSQLLSGFFLILKYMFKGEKKHVNDYKVALVRTQTFSSRKVSKTVDGWIGWKSGLKSDFTYSLNFWCFNPGVTFGDIGIMTKSIILTSGTLSPMGSFESELNVKFPIKYEANHVINREQVWVGTVSKGPTNHILNASYKHSETLVFQDELGRMLLSVCETISRGVLCFLPSYAMLNKLVERWQRSSIWEEIERIKIPITEPRNSEDFENSMKLFYNTIENTKDSKEGEVNGALFIAVCRGKVSEGLDFTDDNARAVIAVGIPFPNTKDIQVNLKREYNDKFSKSKGLLTGSEWYEIQAYRALNQALGRCIRHRYDWGAIILVDERYQRGGYGNNMNRYVKGLSKWVRNSLKHEPSFDVVVSELRNFSNFMNKSSLSRTEKEELKEEKEISNNAKPKFVTPPIFQTVCCKEIEQEMKILTKNHVSKFENAVLEVTNQNLKDNWLLTPIKDPKFIPLTPITSSCSTFNESSEVTGPMTSTQLSEINPQKNITNCCNEEAICNKETASSSYFASTPKSNSEVEIFPIFRSVSKKRRILAQTDNPENEFKNLDTSKKLETSSTVENHLIDLDSSLEKENKHSYSSDDMFKEFEEKTTQQKSKNLNKSESITNQEKKRKKSKRNSCNKTLENTQRELNMSVLAETSVTKSDSDLEDFDLETSFMVQHKGKKQWFSVAMN